MLRLIAYDIADPRRLHRLAEVCQDYGVRVQKSLFECWLEEDAFERLWQDLTGLMDEREDALAAYTLDHGSIPRRRKAGEKMVLTQPRSLYVV